MAGGYGSRYKASKTKAATSGGYGSRFAPLTPPPVTPSTSGGHHGALGFVENLGSDVGHSIEGLPGGLLQTAEHPIRTAQQIGQSYKQTYGPLVHGDVSKFLHQLYEHPLGPLLDAATVLSLGATGAERIGLLPEVAREIELRSPAALAGQDASDILKKPITGGPAQRALKIAAHHAIQRVPFDTPLIGETTRFGKELRHLPQQQHLSAVAKMRDYKQATKGLSNEEFAALHLIGRGVHPTDYANFLKKQGSVEPTMLKVLENKKIIENFEHPSEKLSKAVHAAQKLSEVDAQAKISRGILTPESAAQRIGLHERLVYGDDGYTVRGWNGSGSQGPGLFLAQDKELAKAYVEHGQDVHLHEARVHNPLILNGRAEIDEATGKANAWAREHGETPYNLEAWAKAQGHDAVIRHGLAPYTRGAESTSEALLLNKDAAKNLGTEGDRHQELISGGRKSSAKFYVPDVLPGERLANADARRLGGGFGVPKEPGSLKHNTGTLVRTGRIALSPDLLGPTYLRTLKYGLHDDIHSELMSHAVRLDEDHLRAGRMPPKGWAFVRKKLISKTGNPRPQQIDKTLQASSRTKQGLADLVDVHAPDTEGMKFTADHPDDAERVHGDYLIVPDRLSKDLAGEYHRSNEAVRLLVEKPTKVWRALVLGGRVGFLTNNVIGNHLMFALHAAGPEGLRAFLNAVKREKGPGVVQSLLKDKIVPPAMRQQFMDEFFPNQVEGTFGHTQAPDSSKFLNRTKTGRTAQKLALGVAPATQAIAEGNLRRALVEFYIRKSPEFKQVVSDMPQQTRDFEAAAAKIIKGEGGSTYQRRISLQVDHVLGNYLNLGPIAQIARGVFPFTAWYKAILSVSGHLALDTPGRTDILLKIGQIGTTSSQKELGKVFGGAENVPSWLLGSVLPLGGKKVFGTTGINPFETINQLGQGAGAIAGVPGSGSLGQAISNLGPNPILLGALQAIAGKNLYTGRDLSTQGGLVGSVLSQTAAGLPQVGLAKALAGHGRNTTTYGKQSGKAALLQYLGVPLKELAG